MDISVLEHKAKYKANEAESEGTEATVEEILEVGLVGRIAGFIQNVQYNAGCYQDVEEPTNDFDEKFHCI